MLSNKSATSTNQRRADIIAATWGFAEATFFFLIPDMFITWRAITGWRAAWRACWLTLVGALIGGNLMYLVGWTNPRAALNFVDAIPGVTAPTIQQAKDDIAGQGPIAILYGPAKAVPYKVYAVLAAPRDISYWKFLAISVPARLLRFIAVAAITYGLSRALRNTMARRYHYLTWMVVWMGIYALYFAHHWI